MRKCRNCKTRIPKLVESDQYQRNGFCTEDCLIAHWKANREDYRQKATRAREKAHKQLKREVKGNDRRHQMHLTQQVYNRMIRLLDMERGCISCDKGPDWHGQWHCGHYKTTAARPDLRYDPLNTWKQCSPCNLHYSGNLVAYSERLMEIGGKPLLDYLDAETGREPPSCDDLKAMRKEFSAECRRLERGEKPSRDWRKLDEDSN